MNIRKKFSAQFILVTVFVLFIVYTLISNFVFQVKKLNEYKAEISSLNKQISSTKKEIEELKKIEGQDGITLSGGDPMCQSEACLEICKAAKELGLNVWCYTGFTYEKILNNPKQKALLQYIDVLVDGKFVLEEKSLDIYFRGSRNQRIIDVKKSLEEEKVVWVSKYMDEKDYSLDYKKPEHMFI